MTPPPLRHTIPLAVAAGLSFAVGWRVLEEHAIIHNAAQYVAREVTENGLPLPGWRGYRQGWRDGQSAMLRVQLRDVEVKP